MKRNFKFFGATILIVTAILFSEKIENLYAHSGGTDAKGGHYNRKTGGYHYHNSGYTKESISSTKTNPEGRTRLLDYRENPLLIQIDSLDARTKRIEKEVQKIIEIIEKEQEEKQIVVYGTRMGKKYHREGCRYLRTSKIPYASLNEAKRFLSACLICKPPK